jgi:hypothetical protein
MIAFADRDIVTQYANNVDGIHTFSLRPSDRAPGTSSPVREQLAGQRRYCSWTWPPFSSRSSGVLPGGRRRRALDPDPSLVRSGVRGATRRDGHLPRGAVSQRSC